MLKNISILTCLVISIITSTYAHELTHQSDTDGSRVCGNSYGPINLSETAIFEWWSLFNGLNPDLVDVFSLPENSIQPDEDNEYVCSIYAEPLENGLSKTCGEVDYFMIAAQGAAEYCSENHGGVPVFLGPHSFMQAISQNTFGSHHLDYEINEGIVFICQSDCYSSDELNH